MLTYEILKFTMKTIQVAINIIYRTKKANYQHNQKLIDKDIVLYLNNKKFSHFNRDNTTF